jgi:membrane protease YdiL (CAAX protease family)
VPGRAAADDREFPGPAWPLFTGVFLGVVFWGWVFGLPSGNFWWKISIATAFLSSFALWINRTSLAEDFSLTRRDVGWGVVSAGVLYAVFWLGGAVLRAILPESGSMISAVYATRSALPLWALALLFICVIAPAEEIFWRGLIQKHLVRLSGPRFGVFAAALIYALVHLWANNAVLLLAAFVCGLAWGWLYQYSKSLSGPIFSHMLWDLTIFVLAPLG